MSFTGFLFFSNPNPLATLLFTHWFLAATVLCIQFTFCCWLSLLFYHLIEKIRQSIYLVQSSLLYFLSAMENILIFLFLYFPSVLWGFTILGFIKETKGDRNSTSGAGFSNVVVFLCLCKHPLCTRMTCLSTEQSIHCALGARAGTASLPLKDTAKQLHITLQGQAKGKLQVLSQQWALPGS